MCLINYNNFEEKERVFNRKTIDTEDDFYTFYHEKSQNKNLRFRTVADAKYRNYTSVQRSWIMQDEKMQKMKIKYGIDSYEQYVDTLLSIVRNDKDIKHFFASENIPINDAVVWAMMQHYGYPTPFVDFSYSIDGSLFFLIPNSGRLPLPKFTSQDTIDDYFSVYIINSNVDWFQASMQRITINGMGKVNGMINVFNGQVDTTDYQKKTTNLDYHDFKDLPFISVDGPALGIQQGSVPILRFNASYNIGIPRTKVQDGLFICIPSEKDVLEDVIKKQTKQMLIECYDINKSLRQYIIDNILTPKNINSTTMYMLNDALTQKIEGLLHKALGF